MYLLSGYEGYRYLAIHGGKIIELKEKYNVGVLLVDDENFGVPSSSKRIAKLMKKHGILVITRSKGRKYKCEDLKFST